MVSTGSMLIPLELPHPGRRGWRHVTAPHARLVVKAAPRVPVTGVPLMDMSPALAGMFFTTSTTWEVPVLMYKVFACSVFQINNFYRILLILDYDKFGMLDFKF